MSNQNLFTFMKRMLLFAVLAAAAATADAQQLKTGYIDWGKGSEKFKENVDAWFAGKKVNDDDNFFISRVKPKKRFTNKATQVDPNMDSSKDRRVLNWIPYSEPSIDALPNSIFDSEVFTLWPYIDHWGSWRAPQGRIPGALSDVAHKNGVAVSGVSSIPWGGITTTWSNALQGYIDLGGEKIAKYLHWFGVDGMGYNSEFSNYSSSFMRDLRDFHASLVKESKKVDPIFENIWYDGTNDNGWISFDLGLAGHNQNNFGDKDNVRTSLFFNYNWDRVDLNASASKAESMGRDPHDLYCGINMQGGEPNNTPWGSLLASKLSIGLWGAHERNMFWESRGELGSEEETKQRAYLLRTERFYSSGTRNPANHPDVKQGWFGYTANNKNFSGLSPFRSAQSTLSWDLATEPFITYFNIGNGKFFNLNGDRYSNNHWVNVGMQDYLPTWRFWFSTSLLGGNSSDVPANGLDAEFVWDDAYFGGSSLRVFGSNSNEYLHLFKTKYELKAGDVITVRYKLLGGSADMNLVLTADGSEKEAVNESSFSLLTSADTPDDQPWTTKTFTVGSELAGKSLALVALHLQNANNLDLRLGEFSIVRGTAATPEAPTIVKASILSNSADGADGKLIFNMPNTKTGDEPCYNLDVNTAYFLLYAEQEDGFPVFMGATTSWAGMYYSIPIDRTLESKRVRLGVQAISLDHKSESDVVWSDYMDLPNYVYNDDIKLSKKVIKPGMPFTMEYVDGQHEDGEWKLVKAGTDEVVFSGTGRSVTCDGLSELGSYDLQLTGNVYNADGTSRTSTTRTFGSFIQITSEGTGALPEIKTLTANDQESDIDVAVSSPITMHYTGNKADGAGSQGVDLNEKRFGVKLADLGLTGTKSFTVAFWLKINSIADGETQLLSVADKTNNWPKTDWGWIWSNFDKNGKMTSFTFRGTDATSNNELQYTFGNTTLPVGNWVHIAYVFDWQNNSSTGFKCSFYVNGKKQIVTKWKRAQDYSDKTSEPTYAPNVYTITDGMVLAIGGDAHGRNGIRGAIDNFEVFEGALTDDQVKATMGDLNASSLPTNLVAGWTLEEKPQNNVYKSIGKKANVDAGLHSYTALEGEGQGRFHWDASEVTSGCPFLSGTAFPVTTTASWKTSVNGQVTNATGNDQEGSAVVTYGKAGYYEVTLTLTNSLGSDQRSFGVITVGDPTNINVVETAENARVYTVNGSAYVQFTNSGNYTVQVYNATGALVAQKAQSVTAGQSVQVSLPTSGVYIVKVVHGGKTVRVVKLINKL